MNLIRSYKLYKLGIVTNPVFGELFADIDFLYENLNPIKGEIEGVNNTSYYYKNENGDTIFEYLYRMKHVTLIYREKWENVFGGYRISIKEFCDFIKVILSELYDIEIIGMESKIPHYLQ